MIGSLLVYELLRRQTESDAFEKEFDPTYLTPKVPLIKEGTLAAAIEESKKAKEEGRLAYLVREQAWNIEQTNPYLYNAFLSGLIANVGKEEGLSQKESYGQGFVMEIVTLYDLIQRQEE